MDVSGMSPGEVLLRQEIQRVEDNAKAARGREATARDEAERLEARAAALTEAAGAVHAAV